MALKTPDLRTMTAQFINPATIPEDVAAGVVLGVESVPDGLAAGLLAAVNPVFGLYAYMMGTFTGAFFTSSVFMSVQATGAMALVVASVPQVTSGPNAEQSLFALSILTGIIMTVLGIFKMGSMVRFVPNAVMAGFINAVAINIILGQLDSFTGSAGAGANRIVRTLDLAQNPSSFDLPTLMIGITTIVLIITLEKTRLGALGLVVAMIISSLLVLVFNAGSVALVNDIATIPASLPRPALPPLSLILPLIVPALSLTFVGLVQGAGISKNFVNPDGKYPDASRDFIGQGVANVFSGLFQGMPVGGSMSATSIVTNAGARSRFANITAGIVMAVVILLFSRSVGYIAMPALAGLLIVIGFRTLKPAQVKTVWKTGRVQQVVMIITFVASLIIPLQYAVLIGVAMSLLLYVIQQSNKITIKQWVRPEGKLAVEVDPPDVIPGGEITLLVPYGSLFFATAPLFESQLPEVTAESVRAVVILNLRGETDLGSTFLAVVERYALELQGQGSKLMLAAVAPVVQEQLIRTGLIELIGRQNIYLRTENLGEALFNAWADAERWIDGTAA
jgi:SulP family sulfate permease